MGNNTNSNDNSLPTMTEDSVGTIFSPTMDTSNGIPDEFDIEQHQNLINQLDSVIEDQKFEHHPDDFRGHEDDEQVNYEIYRSYVEAGEMLQNAINTLNEALDEDDMGFYDISGRTYEKYVDSMKELIEFMNDIPEM